MNKKDYTRKPVIRDPLPEKDWTTLCELVTWRAIGKAWSARRLKGLMKRNRGQRRPAFLWDSFEREAANVVSLCRQGELSPNGSVDGNPHQPFSEGYFLSDVYADPVSDSIGPDPLAWPSAKPYPDENPEEPRELPIYRSVQFFRSDVLSPFEQADQPATETAQAPAGGAQDDAEPAQAVSGDAQDAVAAVDATKALDGQLQAAELLELATPAVPPLDLVNLTRAERAAPTRTKAETVGGTAKRTFSRSKVREWYKKRVKEWPPDQKQPSRKEDIRAAKNEWGEAVTHRTITELRNEFASEWTKSGRPPANS